MEFEWSTQMVFTYKGLQMEMVWHNKRDYK